MWNAKGRSGYGDTNLDGTYDDVILGVSPNGRQYRNEATLETRALSGWAYWNLRKQITPEQEIPEGLYARNETESMSHTLANGKANLAKYSDPVAKQPKKKAARSIAEKILPQQVRYDNLCKLMDELESERSTMADEDYYQYHAILQAKIDRQWQLLSKAAGWNDEHTQQAPSHTFSPKAATQPEFMQEKKENSVKKAVHSAKTDAILFITGAASLLALVKFFF